MKEDSQNKVVHAMVIYKETQYHKNADCLQMDQIQYNSIKI